MRSLPHRPPSSQLCKVSLCEGLGYSLAEVQADAGVACAADLESRAATGAVRVQAQLQVYNPTAFSLHVGSLSAAMSEGASFSGAQPGSWGATFDASAMVRAAPSLPPAHYPLSPPSQRHPPACSCTPLPRTKATLLPRQVSAGALGACEFDSATTFSALSWSTVAVTFELRTGAETGATLSRMLSNPSTPLALTAAYKIDVSMVSISMAPLGTQSAGFLFSDVMNADVGVNALTTLAPPPPPPSGASSVGASPGQCGDFSVAFAEALALMNPTDFYGSLCEFDLEEKITDMMDAAKDSLFTPSLIIGVGVNAVLCHRVESLASLLCDFMTRVGRARSEFGYFCSCIGHWSGYKPCVIGGLGLDVVGGVLNAAAQCLGNVFQCAANVLGRRLAEEEGGAATRLVKLADELESDLLSSLRTAGGPASASDLRLDAAEEWLATVERRANGTRFAGGSGETEADQALLEELGRRKLLEPLRARGTRRRLNACTNMQNIARDVLAPHLVIHEGVSFFNPTGFSAMVSGTASATYLGGTVTVTMGSWNRMQMPLLGSVGYWSAESPTIAPRANNDLGVQVDMQVPPRAAAAVEPRRPRGPPRTRHAQPRLPRAPRPRRPTFTPCLRAECGE